MSGRECATCNKHKQRHEFSNNQLKKTIGTSVCTACVNSAWQEPKAASAAAPISDFSAAGVPASLLQALAAQGYPVEEFLPLAASLSYSPALAASSREDVVAKRLRLAETTLQSAPPLVAAPDLISLGLPLPRIVVFDLDDTCWKQGLDRKGSKGPPYTWCGVRQTVVDSGGVPVVVLPAMPASFLALHRAGVQLAVASHNAKPAWCNEVMDKFMLDESAGLTWGDLVPQELRVISCASTHWPLKNQHLRDICARLPGGPCSFSEMVLFDDGKKICSEANNLGVVAIRCLDGITLALLMEGLKECARKALSMNGHRQPSMSSSLSAGVSL